MLPRKGHTVTAFDKELNQLSSMVSNMGKKVIAQIQNSVKALEGDNELALMVSNRDVEINKQDDKINKHALKMLALRQPMAKDLRMIVSSLSISSDLERIGDYAKNVADRSVAIESRFPSINKVLSYMSSEVEQMINLSLDSYKRRDEKIIFEVLKRDDQIDELYNSVLRTLITYMMEDQKNVGVCISFMFIAKRLERAGDLAVHMAQKVYFMIHGKGLDKNI